MKYSLRSLMMKFTIRDLFLTMAFVVVCAAWWIERTRAERLAEEIEGLEAAGDVIIHHAEYTDKKNEELQRKLDEMLNSQAPATNPPQP